MFSERHHQTVWRKKLFYGTKKCNSIHEVWGRIPNGLGAYEYQSRGKISFYSEIMDHIKYVNMLKENLPLSVEKVGWGDNNLFTQDNDPKHTAWKTMTHQQPLKVLI